MFTFHRHHILRVRTPSRLVTRQHSLHAQSQTDSATLLLAFATCVVLNKPEFIHQHEQRRTPENQEYSAAHYNSKPLMRRNRRRGRVVLSDDNARRKSIRQVGISMHCALARGETG